MAVGCGATAARIHMCPALIRLGILSCGWINIAVQETVQMWNHYIIKFTVVPATVTPAVLGCVGHVESCCKT